MKQLPARHRQLKLKKHRRRQMKAALPQGLRHRPREPVRSLFRERAHSPLRERARSLLREPVRSRARERVRSPLREPVRSRARERARSRARGPVRSRARASAARAREPAQVQGELLRAADLPAAANVIRTVPARRAREVRVRSAPVTSPAQGTAWPEDPPVREDIQEMTRIRAAPQAQVRVRSDPPRAEVRQAAEAAWNLSRWKKKAA